MLYRLSYLGLEACGQGWRGYRVADRFVIIDKPLSYCKAGAAAPTLKPNGRLATARRNAGLYSARWYTSDGGSVGRFPASGSLARPSETNLMAGVLTAPVHDRAGRTG